MTKKRRVLDAKADKTGDITHVLLDGNTNYTPVHVAIPMADRGDIEGVHVVRSSDKKTHLRTNKDNKTKNNLDDMAGDN